MNTIWSGSHMHGKQGMTSRLQRNSLGDNSMLGWNLTKKRNNEKNRRVSSPVIIQHSRCPAKTKSNEEIAIKQRRSGNQLNAPPDLSRPNSQPELENLRGTPCCSCTGREPGATREQKQQFLEVPTMFRSPSAPDVCAPSLSSAPSPIHVTTNEQEKQDQAKPPGMHLAKTAEKHTQTDLSHRNRVRDMSQKCKNGEKFIFKETSV